MKIRFAIKRRLLSKYVRLVENNKRPRLMAGKPAALDELGLSELIHEYQSNQTWTNVPLKLCVLQKYG